MSKLIPTTIAKKIPSLEATAQLGIEDQVAHVRLFLPGTAATWWISSLDVEGDLAFGFATLGDPEMAELGYISLSELEGLRVGLFRVERDLHFSPTPMSEVIEKVRQCQFV